MSIKYNNCVPHPQDVNRSSGLTGEGTQKNQRVRASTGGQRSIVTVAPVVQGTVSKPGHAGQSARMKSYSVPASVSRKVAETIKTGTNDEIHQALEKVVRKRHYMPVLRFVDCFEGQEKAKWRENAVKEVERQLDAVVNDDFAKDQLKILGITLLEEGAFKGKSEKAAYEAKFELNLG